VTGLGQASGQVWTLVSHQLQRRWRSFLIWGVALGALGALYVCLFPSMGDLLSKYMENAPEYMQGWMGDLQGPITAAQWMGMEFLNMLVPVALPFLVIAIGARTVAGSEERKTLDLLLSNPLTRRRVIAGAVGTMAISLAGVLAATWVITYVAASIAGVDLSPGDLAAALVALWPFCLLFGTFALLISTLARRAVLATVIPAAILVIMYVFETLGQVSKTMEPARVVSLFHHLGKPIEGDFPWTAFLCMLAGVCILAWAAGAAFSKRDVYT
jgi:beta-exotoxin I transport system permease protein